MSVLWVLPLLIFAVGAVVLWTAARSTAEAGAQLRDECVRLQELQVAVDQLQQETDVARALLDGLRGRPDSGARRG